MTSDHERHSDDVAAYALGALNELEATAFERHLMRCDTCARELEGLRSAVGALPAAAPQQRAPAELKQRVMDAIAEEPSAQPAAASRARRRSLGRLRLRRPALALAGGLASVALVLGAYGLGASRSDESAEVLAATVDRTQLPDARAELAARGDLGVLRTTDLPPAGERRVYVVWLDRGDGPVYASSFNVEPDGTGAAGIRDLDSVEQVMVTRERSTAVAHPTESPVLTVQLD